MATYLTFSFLIRYAMSLVKAWLGPSPQGLAISAVGKELLETMNLELLDFHAPKVAIVSNTGGVGRDDTHLVHSFKKRRTAGSLQKVN